MDKSTEIELVDNVRFIIEFLKDKVATKEDLSQVENRLDGRIDKVESRLDNVIIRLDGIDRRLEVELDKRKQLDVRVGKLEQKVFAK